MFIVLQVGSKMEKRSKLLLFLLVVLLISLMVLWVPAIGYVNSEMVDFGEVDVTVYVVALDGVESREVNNVSRTVEGALHACNLSHCENNVTFNIDPGWGAFGGAVYGRIKMHVETLVITTWELYKEVVETSRRTIIVNAHGETLPIPAGYTRNRWVDEIAESMLNREVAWVHTAGYPFNYSWDQGSGEILFGHEGFQRLMKHIRKSNITCDSPYYKRELWGITTHIGSHIAGFNWVALSNAFWVELGNPLKASDFDEYSVLPLWGCEYYPGGIVKFASSNIMTTFGFYIHIGTYGTYNSAQESTDSDYYRGYAGTALALYFVTARTVAEDTILKAEEAISEAKGEGRTKGLEDAEDLLEKAWEQFFKFDYIGRTSAITYADEAIQAAEVATEPSLFEAYGILMVLGFSGIAIISTFAVRHKINSKKKK